MRRARPLGKGGEPKIDFGVPWSWVYCDRREIPEDVFRRMSEEQREEALLWRHPVYAGSGEPVKGWDGRDIGELVKGNGAEPIIPRSEYLQGIDPLRYCYKLPGWDDVLEEWDNYKIIIIFGGNRSGKSNFGAAVSSWMARNVPGFKGVSWSPTDATSIETPQSLYHYYLPEDYRDPVKERGRYMSLTYSQKNGFSDHKCILPPVRRGYGGSEMRFLNYASYGRHSGVAQGWNAHLVHCDEQLPKKLMSDMISRTSDVNGKILWTYTTLDGWVPSVAEVLHKAETLESRYAPLVREDLPVKQVSRHIDSCLIVYWWTQDNLFIINELRQLLEGLKTRPRAEQLAVAYGVVTKSATTKFPLFSRETNVVKHETIPFIEDPSVPHTVYQSLDPAGRKELVLAVCRGDGECGQFTGDLDFCRMAGLDLRAVGLTRRYDKGRSRSGSQGLGLWSCRLCREDGGNRG